VFATAILCNRGSANGRKARRTEILRVAALYKFDWQALAITQ
jgi:hypothetical protein